MRTYELSPLAHLMNSALFCSSFGVLIPIETQLDCDNQKTCSFDMRTFHKLQFCLSHKNFLYFLLCVYIVIVIKKTSSVVITI